MSEKNNWIEKLYKHKVTLLWIGVYVLLIVSGLRYDCALAIFTATAGVASMLILDWILKRLLIKQLLRAHHQIYYYVASFIVIHIMVWATVMIEAKTVWWMYHQGYINLPLSILEEGKRNMIYPVFRSAFLLLCTFAITTSSYLFNQAKKTTAQNSELRNQKLDMELRYLKAQVNPHFLFNALNNIYSLVYTNDENAAESILKLSEMLRYVTDECQAESISIAKEVKYIENYIDFQLLRMENHPNVTFSKDIQNPGFKIPPMLLQPLIENSFKHSRIENHRDGYVNINIVQSGKSLEFTAENSMSRCVFNSDKERGGIGVANVEKRLYLAYGKNYSMNVENNSQFYRVVVRIHCDQA